MANLAIPEKNEKNVISTDWLEIHKKVKQSGDCNFKNAQICVPTNLNVDLSEKLLKNYWDRQFIFLLRYGFPLDINKKAPLNSAFENHHSALINKAHVEAYIAEEIKHGAMVSHFKEPPLDMHISPFLTRPKPDSDRQRVIIDLSYPPGHSINAAVQKDVYLDTPFLLTLPTVDTITSKIISLGRGSHIFKIDISHAFRHLKIDPGDINFLGLQNDGFFWIWPYRSGTGTVRNSFSA